MIYIFIIFRFYEIILEGFMVLTLLGVLIIEALEKVIIHFGDPYLSNPR